MMMTFFQEVLEEDLVVILVVLVQVLSQVQALVLEEVFLNLQVQ